MQKSQPFVVRATPHKGQCLFATRLIAAGTLIARFEGQEIDRNTMHSIHLGGKRLEGDSPLLRIAHACDPNCQFRERGRDLYALRDIQPGEELTIDYLYTEPVIAFPFQCHCGAANCRGWISV